MHKHTTAGGFGSTFSKLCKIFWSDLDSEVVAEFSRHNLGFIKETCTYFSTTHLTTLSGSDCQQTVHLNVKIIFRVSLCLFNAGNHVYIFNQLPTAKESATLWYTFPGKKLQSCPIMYVCAFTMYIHKPHALGFSIKKVVWLATYIQLPVVNALHRTHTIHMQQGKVRFVVLLTDFLLVLNLLEPCDHSRKAVKKQLFEDHMFSDNKYATNKVRLVMWRCL